MFAIYKTYITEPQYSVDGKRHQKRLYYSGMRYLEGVGSCHSFDVRNKAKLYETKKEAETAIRIYRRVMGDAKVIEIR